MTIYITADETSTTIIINKEVRTFDASTRAAEWLAQQLKARPDELAIPVAAKLCIAAKILGIITMLMPEEGEAISLGEVAQMVVTIRTLLHMNDQVNQVDAVLSQGGQLDGAPEDYVDAFRGLQVKPDGN